MATKMATIRDFIDVLDSAVRKQVSSRILPRDLLAVPKDVTTLKKDVGELKEDVTTLKKDVGELKEDVTTLKKDVTTLREDVGELKGSAAETKALSCVGLLARKMGMVGAVRRIERLDVYDLPNSWDTTGIPRGDVDSFREADAILEAQEESGQACYIAVEISYTVNGRDTRRALRNAGFLTRFTGKPAHAAVMGVRIDNRVRELIYSGEVYWYKLDSIQAH